MKLRTPHSTIYTFFYVDFMTCALGFQLSIDPLMIIIAFGPFSLKIARMCDTCVEMEVEEDPNESNNE